MKIRLLTLEDWQIWRALRLEALQNSPETLASSKKEEIGYSQKEWEDKLTKSDIFGAFIDNKLISAVGFHRLNRLKTMHRGDLFAMYVTPEFRGQGIASQLIETVINYAKSRVIQLHLSCVTNNESAVKLYQKHGFKIYGTEPRSLKIDDNFFDEYLMLLELDK